MEPHKNRPKLGWAKERFAEIGVTLLANEYVNNREPMPYQCDKCSDVHYDNLANFTKRKTRGCDKREDLTLEKVKAFECGKNKIAGENNYQWIEDREGGVRRSNREAREWRTQVFQRDDYTCQCCGERGAKLNAHHLHDYQHHRELALEVSNGVTLCKKCHVEFHKQYGTKAANTPDQFIQFKEARHG